MCHISPNHSGSCSHLPAAVLVVVLGMIGRSGVGSHLQLWIKAMHNGNLILGTELDLADPGGLQDTTTSISISIKLDAVWIDVPVDDDPCTTTDLTLNRSSISVMDGRGL